MFYCVRYLSLCFFENLICWHVPKCVSGLWAKQYEHMPPTKGTFCEVLLTYFEKYIWFPPNVCLLTSLTHIVLCPLWMYYRLDWVRRGWRRSCLGRQLGRRQRRGWFLQPAKVFHTTLSLLMWSVLIPEIIFRCHPVSPVVQLIINKP